MDVLPTVEGPELFLGGGIKPNWRPNLASRVPTPSFYDHPSLRHDISRIVQLIQDLQDLQISPKAPSSSSALLSPRIWTTWMGRNLVESTEKPGGPGMWEGEKGGTTGRSWQDGKGVAQLAVVELLKGRGRWFGVRCRRACS
jgi:hypothetical protein